MFVIVTAKTEELKTANQIAEVSPIIYTGEIIARDVQHFPNPN